MPESIEMVSPLPFVYSTGAVTIPANDSSSPQINFDNITDFLLQEIRQTNQEAGEVLFQIQYANSFLFSNNALDSTLYNAVDNNSLKYYAYPQNGNRIPRIPANSRIIVTLTNTTGSPIVHRFDLVGYKVKCRENT